MDRKKLNINIFRICILFLIVVAVFVFYSVYQETQRIKFRTLNANGGFECKSIDPGGVYSVCTAYNKNKTVRWVGNYKNDRKESLKEFFLKWTGKIGNGIF